MAGQAFICTNFDPENTVLFSCRGWVDIPGPELGTWVREAELLAQKQPKSHCDLRALVMKVCGSSEEAPPGAIPAERGVRAFNHPAEEGPERYRGKG